jgi:hypothetical protein
LQDLVGAARKVSGGRLVTALDLADVGRVVAHLAGKALLRDAADLAPAFELGDEVVGGELERRSRRLLCGLSEG